jgi:hypothetical protein
VTHDEMKKFGRIIDALSFYADPESYLAIAFFFDPPCGWFEGDFDDGHGYGRPMPGKLAREALKDFYFDPPSGCGVYEVEK